MNQTLYYISLAAFLALPALLLTARFVAPSGAPWRAVIALLMLGSWLSVNSAVYFLFEHLADLVRGQVNPSQELLDRWQSDGAARVFALIFGWLYGLLYAVPFFAAFALASWWRRRRQARTRPAA